METELLDAPRARSSDGGDVAPPARSATTGDRRDRRRATLALLLACLVWGGSFSWAKAAIARTCAHAGVDAHSALGPLLMIGWRFALAGLIWVVIFPKARRGWSMRSVGRSMMLGVIFAAGMMTQQWGLTYTSEAVSAFLTSLSILFVPLMLTLVLRRPPAPTLWFGIALATAGIWLMTGATPTGFGVGEALGLACSLVFSSYIFVMNAAVERDDPWRMAAGQFLAIGVICGVASVACFPAARSGAAMLAPMRADGLFDMAMLVVFATIGGFGLMTFYQPKLDPSRAALIYLIEPICAAGYAFVFAGRSMTGKEIAGGAMILAANALAEWIESRKRSRLRSDAIAEGAAR